MKNTTYFGFSFSNHMIAQGPATLSMRDLTIEEAKSIIDAGVSPCLNPSHTPTISAMRNRFSIDVPVPEKAPRIALAPGDSVVVMAVIGLPRLEHRHEYTQSEIDSANFKFTLWTRTS